MTTKRRAPESAAAAEPAPGDAPLQSSFFSVINTLTEPAVRAGVGSLWFLPAGMIVLETTGRRSGAPRRVTLLAAEIGNYVVVNTMRVRRSQWLRNVAAKPAVRYWIRGNPHDARAIAVLPGEDPPKAQDEDLRCVIDTLHRQASVCGAAFVLLVPHGH
jgi:deazaflavin-dependent oxidoreductase (nitroreductase family)